MMQFIPEQKPGTELCKTSIFRDILVIHSCVIWKALLLAVMAAAGLILMTATELILILSRPTLLLFQNQKK